MKLSPNLEFKMLLKMFSSRDWTHLIGILSEVICNPQYSSDEKTKTFLDDATSEMRCQGHNL